MKFKGWIIAEKEDEEFLKELGIKVGYYDHQHGEFKNCLVDKKAYDKLDKYWGNFYWGLRAIDEHEGGGE